MLKIRIAILILVSLTLAFEINTIIDKIVFLFYTEIWFAMFFLHKGPFTYYVMPPRGGEGRGTAKT